MPVIGRSDNYNINIFIIDQFTPVFVEIGRFLILSEGAQPAKTPLNEEASPIPAVVIAVFFKNTRLVVIVK